LTEFQCIEIAEKVWGWEKVKFNSTDPDSFDCWIDENRQLVCDDTVIDEHASKAVNSWQGFGRTVEAMDKLDYEFQMSADKALKKRWSVWFQSIDDNGFVEVEGNHESADLIEATHLAALEAVNER